MKRILITGGAGFVGSSLAIAFKQHNTDLEVVCFDNLMRRGSELNVSRLQQYGIQFVHGDVRLKEDLFNVPATDWLIECSAEPSVHAGSNGNPNYLIQTNLNGAINCLEYCRENQTQMIFLSSSRVYPIAALRDLPLTTVINRFELEPNSATPGVSQEGISEAFSLEGFRSLYGTTKLSAELFIQEYAEMYNLKAIINRCGVLAGPWQMGKVDQGFMALWVAKHLYNGQLKYMGFGGQGLQVRDVLHVSDLFDLLQLQMRHVDQCQNTVFNVGGGRHNSVSLAELTDCVREVTGAHCEIQSDPKTKALDMPYYVSDNSKIKTAFSWQIKKSVPAIVEEVAKWIKDNESQLRPILMA